MHYMAQPLSFRWDPEFVKQIDRVRGDVSRSVWVRRAVELRLTEEQFGPGAVGEFGAVERALGEPSVVAAASRRSRDAVLSRPKSGAGKGTSAVRDAPVVPAPAEQPANWDDGTVNHLASPEWNSGVKEARTTETPSEPLPSPPAASQKPTEPPPSRPLTPQEVLQRRPSSQVKDFAPYPKPGKR